MEKIIVGLFREFHKYYIIHFTIHGLKIFSLKQQVLSNTVILTIKV